MMTRSRTIADRLSRAAEVSFVGRDQELDQLRAALDAPELPFVVAFLHGPGGIGKSSLIRAACRLVDPSVRPVALDCRDIEPTPEGFLAALATAIGASDRDAELEKLVAKVGRRVRVLVDTVGEEGAIARSAADAPEIDGTVRIPRPGKLKAGDWADVEITGADAYDLAARIARAR